MRQSIDAEFGSAEQWKRHYIERASGADMQKGYPKPVEWYGDKESALKAMTNPPGPRLVLVNQTNTIWKKLADCRYTSVDSFEIRRLIGAYSRMLQQVYRIKQERSLMLAIASTYRSEPQKRLVDEKYGGRTAEFFASAVKEFYRSRAADNRFFIRPALRYTPSQRHTPGFFVAPEKTQKNSCI